MIAIEVKNISKTYKLYNKPIDRLKEMLFHRPLHTPFQPLKNIHFSLLKGSSLGIIGDNGAGKSTLLKILSKTLTPTTGEVIEQGRVAALLELGAGFHPEFTGRENIYLNAALLGLNEAEIKEKEAAIIDFSELSKFIDRPVKTYSSGMYVRLAFSIATAVDPDILIIDEALSVGDSHFQKKCIKRMMQFKEQGITLLFCSHSMYLIKELCQQTIWLQQGTVQSIGNTEQVIAEYVAYLEERQASNQVPENRKAVRGESILPDVIIHSIQICDTEKNTVQQLQLGKAYQIIVQTKAKKKGIKGYLAAGLLKPDGQLVFASSSRDSHNVIHFDGEQESILHIPSLPLVSGAYRLIAIVTDESTLCPFHEYITQEELSVLSEHPQWGMFWIAHHWSLPE